MRLPGRLHITWADATTLQIDTDAGTQTRLLALAPARRRRASRAGRDVSSAQWKYAGGARGDAARRQPEGRHHQPAAGYVRKNGAPHSDKAVVTEYFDLNTAPNGDRG